MTRPEAARAAASWPELIAALRQLSDDDFAALDPTSLASVTATVRVRFGIQTPSGQG